MPKGRFLGTGDATDVLRDAIAGRKTAKGRGKKQSAQGSAVWLDGATYDIVRRLSKERGITRAALIRSAISAPSYASTPAMRDAKVLVRIADLLRTGDVEKAREVVREAMRALSKEHAAAVDTDPRAWDGT